MSRRKRIKESVVCSSDDYKTVKGECLTVLQEPQKHFNQMTVNGEITFDTPIFKDGKPSSKFKTIRVLGKNVVISIEEYNTHCAHLGL